MVGATSCRHTLKRLTYVEGHLAGIRRLLEEERERLCVEIMRQTHAVRRAIGKMESLLLWSHLETCADPVASNVKRGQRLRGLVQLYAIVSKRKERYGSDTGSP